MEPPMHRPFSLLGSALDILRWGPAHFLQRTTAVLGPIFRFRLLQKTFVILSASENKELLNEYFHNKDLVFARGTIQMIGLDLFLYNGQEIAMRNLHSKLLRTKWQSNLDQEIHSISSETVGYLDTLSTDSSIKYSGLTLNNTSHHNLFPYWVLRFIFPFMSNLHQSVKNLQSALLPIISTTRTTLESQSPSPKNLLHQLISTYKDDNTVASNIILLTIPATGNTVPTLLNALFQIPHLPHTAVTALRGEIDATTAGKRCRKRDCETDKYASMRVGGYVVGGYMIRKDSTVLLNGIGMHGQQWMGSGDGEFDAFRWVESGKYASGASSEYLVWGGGVSSCPGRFLAVNQVKAILCCILGKFDVTYAGGVEGVVGKSIGFASVKPGMVDGKVVGLNFQNDLFKC
ncbi:cytochrome P450 [Rhizoclosmatium globosum]|uniref:Cytochrome P450 n=1 Tax=Rhizoclosmatium globosum TaxID=329046 RepID=A0A1Y2CC21_9FUNG|nr:cytochrome P450 [Rhizoclosmatium globosum]|eukprot:ORY44394.1 cytochrome P450 [Rhizoclosmatium globosum]